MTTFFEQPKKKAPAKATRPTKPGVRNPNSANSKRLAKKTEENLTVRQQAMADEFVTQYLRDFNARYAYIRTHEHFNPFEEIADSTAAAGGYSMLRWPYVARKLKDAMEAAEEKGIITRNEILFGLKRESNYMGPGSSHAARISGWGTLAKIMGMETKKLEATLAMKGGIMVVPAVDDVDDWEKRASKAQAALKEAVKT